MQIITTENEAMTAYSPADFRVKVARITRARNLAPETVQHWIKVHNRGATLVIRGVSKTDAQAKTYYVAL